ncbi:MAG: SEL1-like repeat protein [Myxococcales bacterium]|nr:SEL1-like repeat protein [Myxococcales bacterium]
MRARTVVYALSFAILTMLGACPKGADPRSGTRALDESTSSNERIRSGVEGELGLTRYRAILFSAQTYEDKNIADLDTPTQDIRQLKSVLEKRYGFDVKTVENATRNDIINGLDAIRRDASETEAVLIYYAGHGKRDDAEDRGYWLPSDARIDSKDRWISNDDLAAKMRAIEARHVLLVVDSCFSGSFRGGSDSEIDAPSGQREAKQLASKRSRWVITSGGNEPVADGGRDGMSVFAYYLRKALEDAEGRYVTVDTLFPPLRERVQANSDQTPQQGQSKQAFHEDGQLVMLNTAACDHELARKEAQLRTQAELDWDKVRPLLEGPTASARAAIERWVAHWSDDPEVAACDLSREVTVPQLVEARTILRMLASQPVTPPPARTTLDVPERKDGRAATWGGVPQSLLQRTNTGQLAPEPGDALDPQALQTACASGQAARCVQLASLFQTGASGRTDPARAVVLLRQGCEGGEPQGCSQLGWMYEAGKGDLAANDSKALELYTRGCNEGDPSGCTSAGVMHAAGRGTERDAAYSAKMFSRGCDGGDARGCTYLGVNLEGGVGVSEDADRAGRLYRRGCDGGHTRGCTMLGLTQLESDPEGAEAMLRHSCDAMDGLACSNLGLMYQSGPTVLGMLSTAAEFYRTGCELGDAGGCRALGVLHEEGRGVEQDARRATDLYEQSCDGGDALGCTYAGINHQLGIGTSSSATRAADLYERGCEVDEALGCTFLGLLIEQGKVGDANPALAAALYTKGCELGDGIGCSNLGVLHENGSGVEADPARAVALYERGCDYGYATACHYAALNHEHGIGTSPDSETAVGFYRASCNLGSADSCRMVGLMVEQGRGATENLSEANALYRTACEGGDAVGCTYLGINLHNGTGADIDLDQALSLYRRGCEGGDGVGCTNAGILLHAAEGSAPDPEQAAHFYREGCDGGNPNGCAQLASLLEQGLGVEQDIGEAAQLYDRACEGDHGMACGRLGTFFDLAIGLPRDGAKAVSLYQRGCELGDVFSCGNLGAHYDMGRDVQPDPEAALALSQQACDGGDLGSCINLLEIHLRAGRTEPARALLADRLAVSTLPEDHDIPLLHVLRLVAGEPWGAVTEDLVRAVGAWGDDDGTSWTRLREYLGTMAGAERILALVEVLDQPHTEETLPALEAVLTTQ